MPSVFQSIQAVWPPAGNALPSVILDTMAALEKQELAFLGLQQSYGTNLPKTLSGPWPAILHIPGGGSSLAPFSFGDSGLAAPTPGGKQKLVLAVDWYIVVGTVNDDLGTLIRTAVDWPIALWQLYVRNKSIGGTVYEAQLTTPSWEQFPYGKDLHGNPVVYYAHVMRGSVTVYYTMPAHS